MNNLFTLLTLPLLLTHAKGKNFWFYNHIPRYNVSVFGPAFKLLNYWVQLHTMELLYQIQFSTRIFYEGVSGVTTLRCLAPWMNNLPPLCYAIFAKYEFKRQQARTFGGVGFLFRFNYFVYIHIFIQPYDVSLSISLSIYICIYIYIYLICFISLIKYYWIFTKYNSTPLLAALSIGKACFALIANPFYTRNTILITNWLISNKFKCANRKSMSSGCGSTNLSVQRSFGQNVCAVERGAWLHY